MRASLHPGVVCQKISSRLISVKLINPNGSENEVIIARTVLFRDNVFQICVACNTFSRPVSVFTSLHLQLVTHLKHVSAGCVVITVLES